LPSIVYWGQQAAARTRFTKNKKQTINNNSSKIQIDPCAARRRYCALGFVAWTAYEVGFVHLFATGRAPHTPDAELLSSAASFLPTVMWTLALPVRHLRASPFFCMENQYRNIQGIPSPGVPGGCPGNHAETAMGSL
jgi:hypothetical protein